MQNEDFMFDTREAAEAAYHAANAAWSDDTIPCPPGKVKATRMEDGGLTPCDDGKIFVVISDDNDYMVPNYEPWEWFLVA